MQPIRWMKYSPISAIHNFKQTKMSWIEKFRLLFQQKQPLLCFIRVEFWDHTGRISSSWTELQTINWTRDIAHNFYNDNDNVKILTITLLNFNPSTNYKIQWQIQDFPGAPTPEWGRQPSI